MARELVAYVHVVDEAGAPAVFGPGDDVPAWAQEQIVNPDAWSEDDAEAAEKPKRATRSRSKSE